MSLIKFLSPKTNSDHLVPMRVEETSLKNGSIKVLAVFALAAISTNVSYASELKLNLDAGYDDNPFRLAERFNPEGSEYIEASIRGELDLSDSFFLKGSFKNRTYGSDAEDADNYRATAGFGYRTEIDRIGDKARSETTLVAGKRDKTYVSRLSGQIGESSGQLVEERYNYDFLKLKSDLKVKWNKANRSKFYIELEQREYEDFSQLGLSNFDYFDVAFGGDWRHRFSKQSSIKLGLEKSYRIFDDRRERDGDGNSIANSDLTYDAWQVSAGYIYKLGKQWRFALNAQYDRRFDSGPGYYDWERTIIGANARYKPNKQTIYRLSATYSDDVYEERAAIASVDDEELSEQQGFRYRLGYERKLDWIDGLSIRANYRYDDFDADVVEYRYDRHQVSVGLGYEL